MTNAYLLSKIEGKHLSTFLLYMIYEQIKLLSVLKYRMYVGMEKGRKKV